LIGLALVLLGPGSAWAQEASAEGGGGGGGSGYPSRGLGVMSDLVVTGEGVGTIGGVLYDAGRFRFGGGLGLTAIENSETAFAIGGQGYFVLHRSRNADFSLGGSLTLGYRDPPQGDGRVRFAIQAGGQTRFFVVDNGAITAGLGLNVALGGGGFAFAMGSVLLGSVGFQYYF